MFLFLLTSSLEAASYSAEDDVNNGSSTSVVFILASLPLVFFRDASPFPPHGRVGEQNPLGLLVKSSPRTKKCCFLGKINWKTFQNKIECTRVTHCCCCLWHIYDETTVSAREARSLFDSFVELFPFLTQNESFEGD